MKLKDWLAFILLGLAWGSSFLWIKIAVQEVGPFTLVAFRLLFGILGLLVVAAYSRPAWPKTRRLWLALALLGMTNTALPFVLISWGEIHIDSAVAAVLNSTVPLFTMVIAHLFLHDDRLTLTRLLGLSIGFCGIIILLLRDLQGSLRSSILGQAAVLVASLFYAGSTVFARRNARGVSPTVQSLVPLLVADAAIWLLAPFVEAPFKAPNLPLTWLAIAWLGLVGSCLAYLLYFYLLHSVGPTRTTLVTYVFPLVGVGLGVIFLQERLDWNLFLGGALVVGSIAVVNRTS
ncbi:MAG TPA: DMT family transporter [Anaerolineales bacterium]|nr:DMT family transporter [Anaerolineales bacterium]